MTEAEKINSLAIIDFVENEKIVFPEPVNETTGFTRISKYRIHK